MATPAGARDVDGRILAAIARGAHVPVERLQPEATLEQLSITSLDVVSAVFEIEDEFGVEVSLERKDELKTVGDVLAAIKKVLPPADA